MVRCGGAVRWCAGTVRWCAGTVRWYGTLVRWYGTVVRWYGTWVRLFGTLVRFVGALGIVRLYGCRVSCGLLVCYAGAPVYDHCLCDWSHATATVHSVAAVSESVIVIGVYVVISEVMGSLAGPAPPESGSR